MRSLKLSVCMLQCSFQSWSCFQWFCSFPQYYILHQLMAFFQNLSKIVSSQLFTKANSFVLPACYRKVYLQTEDTQKIEYLHSVRSLVKTIEELQNLQSHQQYTEVINNELEYLHDNLDNYSVKIANFVKRGGLLTGEGIGNLYYSAQKLNLSPEWLQNNVHHEAISKIRYMTRENLVDTIAGFKRYHRDSPYLKQLEEQLAKRPETRLEYVSHLPNQPSAFQPAENCTSNNLLIWSIAGGKSKYLYQVAKIAAGVLNQGRYPLHSE